MNSRSYGACIAFYFIFSQRTDPSWNLMYTKDSPSSLPGPQTEWLRNQITIFGSPPGVPFSSVRPGTGWLQMDWIYTYQCMQRLRRLLQPKTNPSLVELAFLHQGAQKARLLQDSPLPKWWPVTELNKEWSKILLTPQNFRGITNMHAILDLNWRTTPP